LGHRGTCIHLHGGIASSRQSDVESVVRGPGPAMKNGVVANSVGGEVLAVSAGGLVGPCASQHPRRPALDGLLRAGEVPQPYGCNFPGAQSPGIPHSDATLSLGRAALSLGLSEEAEKLVLF
jgi:hypothetical protein